MKVICLGIGVGLVALAVGVWAAFGRGDDDAATAGPQVWSVDTAQRFDEFPVYWVGRSFKGLPLVQVARMDWPGAFPGKPYNDPWNEVSFTYGDCTIGPGEESCPAPLTIDIRPYCDLRPEQIAPGVKVGPPEVIRGAIVQTIGSGARLWTSSGGKSVSIGITTTGEVSVGEVIRNLVRLNGGKPANPGEALGPAEVVGCP